MGKELTIAQLTFVDLYDSYTLSLSSDVIAVPCNPDGEALNTKTYEVKYSIRAGEKMVAAKCESAELSSSTISGITIKPSDSSESAEGTISVKVNAATKIPEDSGINISVKTNDSNEFVFDRFISFMNIKSGQDGAPGRGMENRTEYYAATSESTLSAYISEMSGDNTVAVEQWAKTNNDISDCTKGADGYYTVNMNKKHNSYSIVKLTFAVTQTTSLVLRCINYGEPTYDYMLISNISSDENYEPFKRTSSVSEDDYFRAFNTSEQSSSDPQDVIFRVVTPGTYYIYIKVRKDSSDPSSYADTFKFKCMEARLNWQTSMPADYNESNPYLWNYTRLYYSDGTYHDSTPQIITYWGKNGKGIYQIKEWYEINNDPQNAPTSGWTTGLKVATSDNRYLWNYEEIIYTDGTSETTPPHVSGVHGEDGTSGVSLKIVADKGSVFKEGVKEIELSLEMYEGLDKINENVSYEWSRYDLESDTWTILSTGKNTVENILLTVEKSDPSAYGVYKCTVTYKTKPYSDYETLTDDVKDIYHAETEVLNDGKDIDGNCAILCVRLYKNGKEIDRPLTERVYYNQQLKLNNNGTGGYFYIPGSTSTYQFFGDEKNGDYAYFLIYNSMQYFEYTTDSNTAEYSYYDNTLYEKGETGIYYRQKSLEDKYDGQTYRLILAQYNGSRWKPYKPYDAYEYCYVNHASAEFCNITFGNSKVFVVDKRKLANIQAFNIDIYEKVYDDTIPFIYYVPGNSASGDISVNDLWKIRTYVTGSDTHVISVTCSALQVVKTQYIEEVFSRHTDGVYINQVVTEIDSDGQPTETKPFYVKITSQKLSFGAREYGDDKISVVSDKEMVYIGNNSTNITNSVLEGNTTINGDVIISNTAKQTTSQFVIQIENNGSLSLVRG